jgi:hypothetical protein
MEGLSVRRLALFSILLLLLAGTAAALNPVNVAVTSSNPYLTANNIDTGQVTIMVTDGTRKAIGGAEILLSVPRPWALADVQGVTNAGGQFVTTFLPTTTSGTATINVTVTIPATATIPASIPVTVNYPQYVIADLPYKATNAFPSAASVGSVNDITIRVTDQYGNPVTSKKTQTVVSFSTTNTGDGGFVVSYNNGGWAWGHEDTVKVKGISVALNDSGYADVEFAMNTRPGENFLLISPPYPLPPTLVTIRGLANLKPATITQVISPSGRPPTLTTDGSSRFSINYQLMDKFGNPSTGRNLSIFASTGESRVITSNSEGKVTISYGPKTLAGRYIITARSEDSPSVSAVQTVQFLSGKPTNMLLTASPQTMASLDVKKDMVAWVTAKVIDANGNPVIGQTVSFSMVSVNTGTYVQVKGPVLQGEKKKADKTNDEITAVTDENGLATVNFYPGTFVSDPKVAGFSPMAEGTARVRAKWSSITHDLDLAYKNFPYLSVYTSVDPSTTETNANVDVTIRIRGDGYALEPRPVDVFMVTDRSGSMLSDYPDRMVQEISAARNFASRFDYKTDRLGQFSFGGNSQALAINSDNCGKDDDSSDDAAYAKANYAEDGKTYSDYATLDLALSSKEKDITNAVRGLVPQGYTPMRYAIYRAINELKKNGKPDSVKAIVVLSDGDYNYYGDPLARGSQGSSDPSAYEGLDWNYMAFSGVSSQNMAEYAKANSIKIYTIGYAEDISSEGRATLEKLATTTGGKYFYALTGDDLTSFYTQIAGALKDTAGVNTNLAMEFPAVEVNGAQVTPFSSVLEYVPIAGKSTWVTPPPTVGSAYQVDNTADWAAGKLNVKLGTIKVNQEFVVNFTLKVLKDGNIRIVNSGNSRVNFDDNTGFVPVPDTYITALPTGTDKGLGTPKLEITNLHRTNSEKETTSADLLWDISYDGKDPQIREEIHVAPLNSEAYAYRGTTWANNGDIADSYTLGIGDLSPGTYKVRVTGIVSDTSSSFSITQITIPGEVLNPEILIR